MIHWNIIIYGIVMILLFIGAVRDWLDENTGAFNLMGGPSGYRGRLGIFGVIFVFLMIVYSLIWGGIFWW